MKDKKEFKGKFYYGYYPIDEPKEKENKLKDGIKMKNSDIKKIFDNTSSYILTNRDSDITKFALDEINKCTYFRTASLSKRVTGRILNTKRPKTKVEVNRSISNKIGRIVKELVKLGIVVKHTESVRSAWENLYKGNLHDILDKKMEQNYYTLKIKKNKGVTFFK